MNKERLRSWIIWFCVGFLAVSLISFAMNANAGGRNEPDPRSDSRSSADASAAADAHAAAAALASLDLELTQTATLVLEMPEPLAQDAVSAQGGAGGTASAQGGSVGDTSSVASTGPITVNAPTTISAPRERSTRTIKNTPSVITGDVLPTVPCFQPLMSGGLSLPGFGGSLQRGKIDPDCTKREYIRLAAAMGLIERATYMWCKQPMVYEDFGTEEDCLLFEVEKVQKVTATVEETAYETVAETCPEPEPCMHEEELELQAERLAQQANLINELDRRLSQTEEQAAQATEQTVEVDDTVQEAISFREGQREKARASLELFEKAAQEKDPGGK